MGIFWRVLIIFWRGQLSYRGAWLSYRRAQLSYRWARPSERCPIVFWRGPTINWRGLTIRKGSDHLREGPDCLSEGPDCPEILTGLKSFKVWRKTFNKSNLGRKTLLAISSTKQFSLGEIMGSLFHLFHICLRSLSHDPMLRCKQTIRMKPIGRNL